MYHTIIFDLDDTLTDDRENIKEAFKAVMKYRQEEYTDKKFERFYAINKKTWSDRADGILITPCEDDPIKKAEWLRSYRFLQYFDNKISYDEAVKINNIYMNGMKEKVVAREGMLDILKYLKNKQYNLVLATNGPLVPLEDKIRKLGIKTYFKTTFSAEEVGYMKPHRRFYQGLFEKAEISMKQKVLFIGDDLKKDIRGGIENGLDTCWCNYNKKMNTEKYNSKYEIHELNELKRIL